MKNTIWVSFGLLLATTGCRLDPAALLGSNPNHRERSELHSDSSVCQQRLLASLYEVDDKDCATPGEREAALLGITTNSSGDEIHLHLQRLSDGKFPRVVRLNYRERRASNVLDELECVETEASGNTRLTKCKLPKAVIDAVVGYASYAFSYLELKNESCAAIAVYRPKFLDDRCAQESPHEPGYSEEIYYKTQLVPHLIVRAPSKPN